MVRTGGTLSAKMIELVGDLNEQKTMDNVANAIRNIEKKISDGKNNVKLYVELFGRVEDMKKNVSEIQGKITQGKKWSTIKLGVELGDMNVQDINKQIREIEDKFNKSKTGKNMKMEIDFDFKGSASKIKQEMDGIKQFMQKYGEQMKSMNIVNLDSEAKSVKKNAEGIKSDVAVIGNDMDKMSKGIQNEMTQMTGATGKFSVDFKKGVTGGIEGATASIQKVDGAVEKFKYTVDESGKSFLIQSQNSKLAGDQQEILADALKKTDDAQRQLNTAIKNSPKGMSDELAKEAQSHIDVSRAMIEKGKVSDKGIQAIDKFKASLSNLNNESSKMKIDREFDALSESTSKAISQFERLGGSEEQVKKFRREMEEMTKGSTTGMKELQASIKTASEGTVRELQQMENAFKRVNEQDFGKAIKDGDINTLKSYVEQMKGASVASLRLSDAKDKEGNAISRVKVNMEAQNGVVRSSTIEYDKANGKIYELGQSTRTLTESNKGLDGSFSTILGRITQYFGAMQLLQKGMQAFKKTVQEIRAMDEQMTKLARVADPSLNLDLMLERSVGLSRDLGASVQDVVGVVGDLARTFGEFNEEQLLAITRTTTIMKNVSELSLEEASSTLVGTMKAFNIEAEDSIGIIDAFNEVDKNFAISTGQIAQSMERVGATAQTFGIDMEHLIGDITAVGEVTQESGQRIGTALRTIYSRITTHEKAVPMIQGLGIALEEMGDNGPELRNVSDILRDLGGIWGDLSKEQQQSAGLAIAGRNRLTQFLALMNNQKTAIDATTTAYNSQGSAIKEQKQYMNSYEYQMTVMNASATELALTIEKKLVGDAMYLVIKASIDMMDTLDGIIDKFGVLPTIFGGASASLLVLSGKFRGFAFKPFEEGLKGIVRAGLDMGPMASKVSSSLVKLNSGLGSLSSLVTGGLLVAGIVAVAWAIEKLIKKIADGKKANEEARYEMEQAIETYNSQGNEIDTLIDRYEELHNAQRYGDLGIEEQREYLGAIESISTMLPGAVSHIDAQGQAHLRSAESIREQSSALAELAEENAYTMQSMNDERLIELADDMADAQNRKAKATEKADSTLRASSQTYEEYVSAVNRDNQRSMKMKEDYTKAISREEFEMQKLNITTEGYYENASQASAVSFELSNQIKETTVLIGDQTVAYLQASGQFENTSSGAQALIRDYAHMNSASLEVAKGTSEIAEAQEKLKNDSLEFGMIVSGAYNDITEGMNDIDAGKAIEQFDQLILALPEDEFRKGLDSISGNMTALQSVIGQVASGAEIDIERIVQQLESAGMESDTATAFVIALGEAFENQQIKASVSAEELSSYNDELVRTTSLSLEAFDPIQALFGFDRDDVAGMNSHLDVIRLLKNEYGETWHEMDRGKHSINAIADYLNTSTDNIINNSSKLENVMETLSQITIEYDEDLGKRVISYGENADASTMAFFQGMLDRGDSISDVNEALILEFGILEQSQEKMDENLLRLNEKFQEFFDAPNDTNKRSALFTQIQKDLEEMRGSITYAEDEFGNFRVVMADGSGSDYLDTLNEQIEKSGLNLRKVDEEGGGVYLGIEREADGLIERIANLNHTAMDGGFSVDNLWKSVRALIDESTSDEDRETFLKVLTDQVDSFGEGLEVTGNEIDGFKLQMEDGMHNPWLAELEEIIEELGIEIVETTDITGALYTRLRDEEGNTFFTKAKADTEELKEEVEETTEAVEELANPEKEREIDMFWNDTFVEEGIESMRVELDEETEKKRYINLDYDGTDADGKLEDTQHRIERLVGEEHKTELEVDSVLFNKDIDEATEKLNQLDEKETSLKIEPGDLKTFNDVKQKVHDVKIEIIDLEKAMENIRKDLSVTNESMESLLTNTSNINNAHGAIKNLIEITELAVDKMGDLYSMFSSEKGLDTTGIESSAQRISDEAHNIERALVGINNHIGSMNLSLKGMDAGFDVGPITEYRVAVLNSAELIASDMSALAIVVGTQMENVSSAFQQGNVGLEILRVQTSDVLGQIVTFHRLTGEMITTYSVDASSNMVSNYNQGLVGILSITTTFRDLMDNHFKQFYTSMVQKVQLTAIDMRSKFLEGTNGIVTIAEGLPGRIGRGIRDNMAQASSAMTALAKDMVRRFKTELGIHSPSRVFTGLGGDIIDGLVNGLSGSDISNLGQEVFSDFSAGAISTINEIKGYMTFEPVTAGSFGAGFRKTSGFGMRKDPFTGKVSGHRGVDFGAPMGTPIPSQSSGTVVASGFNGTMGNYVRVRSGDGKTHTYMHNSRNNVGVGQTIGRGQVIGLVGSTGLSTGPHVHYEVRVNGVPVDPERKFRGFAEGGFVDKKELAWHGEEGLEAIIPLIPQRRERGLDLWQETGEILGMNSELLSMLVGTRRKSAEYGSSSGFAGLDGEAGAGSSDTGTSGTMKPDYSSFVEGISSEHSQMFTAMSDRRIEDPYTRDRFTERTDYAQSLVDKANIELKALTEQTLKYRDALRLVSERERQLKIDTEDRLRAVRGRQRRIGAEIDTLEKSLSKHSEKERKRYNQLQSEFDNNTKSINDMENSIRELHIAMDDRKIQIHIDYIGELASKYDRVTESITRTIAQSQFHLDQVLLLDDENYERQDKLRSDILKQSIDLVDKLKSQQDILRNEYSASMRVYGKQSKQALIAREKMIEAEDKYRSAVISRINTEIELEEQRIEFYTKAVDKLATRYDYINGSIGRTIAQSQFHLDMMTELGEEDHNREMKIRNDILKQTIDLENKLLAQQVALKKEYFDAMAVYGDQSERALIARERLLEAEDRYRASAIDRIKKEQELANASLEFYKKNIDELADRYDYINGSIDRTIAQSQFYMDLIDASGKVDYAREAKLRNDMLKQTIDLEQKLLTQQVELKKEYHDSIRMYGAQSEEALHARERLLEAEDRYRATAVDRVKREQELINVREDVAKRGVESLKRYYGQTQSMTEKAIEIERKALEKAHESKMSRYDEEISKIESVYDAKIKELDDEKAEEQYSKEIAELSEQRASLMMDVSRASRDTSLEGRKRLAEFRAELENVNLELSKAQKDRQDELYREAIEAQKKIQVDAIEAEKELIDKKQQVEIERLDKQAENAKKYAESMINDNAMWEKLISDFTSGDTMELDRLIEEMQVAMSGFATGYFDNISSGFKDLSTEDKDKFQEEVLLDISNSILESNDDLKEYLDASRVGAKSSTSGGSRKTQSPGVSDLDEKADPISGNRHHIVREGDSLWDLADEYYGDPYKWNTIAQANRGLDLDELKRGMKLLIPFNSGGYTGDWIGEEGKVAMLHKKELVLNESQTRDILNVAKIIDNIAGIIPRMKVDKPIVAYGDSSGKGDTYVIDNLNLNMNDFKGSKDDAKRAFDNMAKELKKRGRK